MEQLMNIEGSLQKLSTFLLVFVLIACSKCACTGCRLVGMLIVFLQRLASTFINHSISVLFLYFCQPFHLHLFLLVLFWRNFLALCILQYVHPCLSIVQTSQDKTSASVRRRLGFMLKKKNYNSTITAYVDEILHELVSYRKCEKFSRGKLTYCQSK